MIRTFYLSAVAHFSVDLILIQTPVEMQTFEDELDRGGNARRTSLAALQLIDSLAQSAHARELVDIIHRREIVANLDIQAALKAGQQLIEFAHFEVVTENFGDRRINQLLHNALFFDVAHGIQLDLAAGRSHDRGEVADAWCDLALFQAQGAAAGVAQHVLIVRDRDAHAHTGALADIVTLARQVRDLRDDLFHELRHDHLQPIAVEVAALCLHNLDLVLQHIGIVRANLRAHAVLERRDDAPAVGVVLRVGAGHHIDIKWQADLIAANLHIALFHNVEQANLNALGEVRQLVDTEDAAV